MTNINESKQVEAATITRARSIPRRNNHPIHVGEGDYSVLIEMINQVLKRASIMIQKHMGTTNLQVNELLVIVSHNC